MESRARSSIFTGVLQGVPLSAQEQRAACWAMPLPPHPRPGPPGHGRLGGAGPEGAQGLGRTAGPLRVHASSDAATASVADRPVRNQIGNLWRILREIHAAWLARYQTK